jgi:molybdenum cofactor cytidylyltransferase
VTGAHIAAVVLAAGLSSRMPQNKLLQPLAGKPVVRHVAEAAAASRAAPVIVVTGHAAEQVTAALAGLDIRFAENRDYAKGLSESLKCGVNCIPSECVGAVILLGDMPFVSAATIDRLIEAFDPVRGREIVVPVSAGRRGNPIVWGRRFFAEFQELNGDKGAKSLIGLHETLLLEVEADDSVLVDLDTPANLDEYGRDGQGQT